MWQNLLIKKFPLSRKIFMRSIFGVLQNILIKNKGSIIAKGKKKKTLSDIRQMSCDPKQNRLRSDSFHKTCLSVNKVFNPQPHTNVSQD